MDAQLERWRDTNLRLIELLRSTPFGSESYREYERYRNTVLVLMRSRFNEMRQEVK